MTAAGASVSIEGAAQVLRPPRERMQHLRGPAELNGQTLDPGDLAAVRDLGPGATVFHAAPDGTIRAVRTA